MKNQNPNDLLRLKHIILTDNINLPNSTVEILKTDTIGFFRNHFKLDEDTFDLKLIVNENGKYELKLTFLATGMYNLKVIK
jgi:hypothetical protein